MPHSKHIIEKAESAIAASSKTLQTEAGHPKASPSPELIDAINQVFALFRVSFHNQYYSAYGDNTQSVGLAKKLWLDTLQDYSPDIILSAASKIISENEYLPTLHKMLASCRKVSLPDELPEARRAYREACKAPSPKANASWSHPAVYLAGRECGWDLLSTGIEPVVFPQYKSIYEQYCDKVLAGEILEAPTPIAIEEKSPESCSKEEAIKQLNKIREQFLN